MTDADGIRPAAEPDTIADIRARRRAEWAHAWVEHSKRLLHGEESTPPGQYPDDSEEDF